MISSYKNVKILKTGALLENCFQLLLVVVAAVGVGVLDVVHCAVGVVVWAAEVVEKYFEVVFSSKNSFHLETNG